MPPTPNLLWLNLSPSLRCLNRPLLQALLRRGSLAQWDYHQTLDEPASLEVALELLDDYLQSVEQPIHLAGHGLSGVLGLLYAQWQPQRVRSLTLLGVSPRLTMTWHAHYYASRRLLDCDRTLVLSMMVAHLFGESMRAIAPELSRRLQADLETSPCPHSLLWDGNIPMATVPVPLLVCGSQDDVIVGPEDLTQWQPWMHPQRGDFICSCEQGRHFFHYFQPQWVSRVMVRFWRQVAAAEGAQALVPTP